MGTTPSNKIMQNAGGVLQGPELDPIDMEVLFEKKSWFQGMRRQHLLYLHD